MHNEFKLTGPQTELTSYPQWAQDMVADCEGTKRSVIEHPLWESMINGSLGKAGTTNFMVGIWPVIERFPAYMAQSLLKTQFGRSAGDNLARRWLVRNIRVEQNHAEYWLNWAEGAGVARERLLHDHPPHGTDGLSRWCEDICNRGTLAAGIVATNYAIEGVTGEWSQMIYDNTKYRESFDPSVRTSALKWLHLHAAYDDTHPWEALEIVCTLMGLEPSADDVAHLAECIKRSYTSMILLGDRCIQNCPDRLVLSEAAA